MRRFLLCLVFALLVGETCAQRDRMLGAYDKDNYPEISFVWHTQKPDTLTKEQFKLRDDQGGDVNFQLKLSDLSLKKTPKSILFLWEDMASHGQQSAFTQEMLIRFFRETSLAPEDNFNVAVFNRKRDGQKMLTPLSSQFTDDKDKLVEAVENHSFSQETFVQPLQTDLYSALSEAFEMMKNEPTDRARIIVLVTAGYNVETGRSNNGDGIVRGAKELSTPIYVITYPFRPGSEETAVVERLRPTYGLHTSASPTHNTQADAAYTVDKLQEWYGDMDQRAYGRDYEIVFTTDANKDGSRHFMSLDVEGVSYHLPPLSFPPPEKTVGDWMKEHLLWVIMAGVLIVLLVVFIILFIHWKSKSQSKKMAESEARQKEELARSMEELASLKKQQAAEVQRRQEEEEELRLAQLMQTKNLFPRFHCDVKGNLFTYSMVKPRVTLGRNPDNDVALNDGTVSGLHAEISFNGIAFEVVNRSKTYTQGILVNGQFFQRCTLRSGDMIALGEAVITFYV